MEDVETLKKNYLNYAKEHPKAVEVLRKADGKKNYKEIAEALGLNKTTVSNLLSTAFKWGLANKNGRLYKKKTGILRYFSRGPKNVNNKLTDMAIKTEKIAKKTYEITNWHVQKQAEMAQSYVWLYTVENMLRELIRIGFKAEQNWWEQRVNPDIKSKVKELQSKESYDSIKKKDELEYTHLGQLKEIIIAKNNWPLFTNLLNEKDKEKFRVIIELAIPLRNAIAHSISLNDDDLKSVSSKFTSILKTIKN